MKFETSIEFFGEDRLASVEWDSVDGEVVVRSVVVFLIIEHEWTKDGLLNNWQEQYSLDVKIIMSDEQISDIAMEINADCIRKFAADYDDGRMQQWEEKLKHL